MEILNSENFKDKTKSGVVLVDFYAEWCGPCHVLGAMLDPLSEARSEDFFKVNTDESTDIASEFGVMSLPTVLLFKDGVEVDRFVGVVDKSDVESKLDNLA